MTEQVSQMKKSNSSWAVALLVLTTVMAGCGGSNDDEAGSPTEFSVVPAEVTFTAGVGTPTGVCVAGGSQTVFIYGGSAPYRIDNTVPDVVSSNKAEVGERGGNFVVTVTQPACLTTAIVAVKDARGVVVEFKISNEATTAAVTPPASAP